MTAENSIQPNDIDKAVTVPEDVYDKPADVTADSTLSDSEKIDILNTWKSNEEALLRASGEGMTGGERPNLQQVVDELEKLQKG